MLQDLRFAIRTFRKNPGFTCAAVLTLALGIGANTAVYSVIDGVLMHPIPFADPDALVVMYQAGRTSEKNSVSYPNLLDWQRRSQTFEAIAGWRNDGFTLSGQANAEALLGTMVTANFFSVLRVQPLHGRMFTQDEDQRGGRRVALLGEDFWKRRFAADRNIVGQTLTLNGRDYTVIGIVPASVRIDRGNNTFFNDVFLPIGQYESELFYDRGTGVDTRGLGRLKPGVTLSQARAEMDAIMRNLVAEYPNENASTYANLVSFKQDVAGDLRPTIVALGVAVGFVLLIACTNVANLMFARSIGRVQEFGIRISLGAPRGRLIRQMLTESVVLSLMGGATGVLVAEWCTAAALAVLPSALPPITHVGINSRVLLFSFVTALLTGILFGFGPAFNAAGVSIHETLKQGGRTTIHRRQRLQHALIVTELALTLVLLVGAGLMMRSLQNLWKVDPGFNPEDVLFFYTGLSPQRASSPEKTRASFLDLNNMLTAIPSVEAASVQVGGLPFRGNTTVSFSSQNDADTSRQRENRSAHFYAVGPDHFRTMGIPLRGRSFSSQDTDKRPLVTIVDEELARTVFPGQDPIGKHIYLGLFERRPAEIIGLAGHVKHAGLDADATDKVRSQFYFPIAQLPDVILPLAVNIVTGIVRSKTPPETLMKSIRTELASFDNSRAVSGEQLMTDAIAVSLAPRRFSLIVLGVFAVMALVLSLIGIYGMVAYFVSQRTNEIGLRMALGARPRDIFYSVIREGGKLGLIGIAIGLAGAAGLTRLMTSFVFGISPTDSITFGSTASLFFLLTLVACYIPARRAVHVDPMTALHCE
jgi:putative ABC transport system permease protein